MQDLTEGQTGSEGQAGSKGQVSDFVQDLSVRVGQRLNVKGLFRGKGS